MGLYDYSVSRRTLPPDEVVRLDNMAIEYYKTANLKAGKPYIGRISESYALKGANNTTLKIVINLEDGSGEVETSHKLEASHKVETSHKYKLSRLSP